MQPIAGTTKQPTTLLNPIFATPESRAPNSYPGLSTSTGSASNRERRRNQKKKTAQTPTSNVHQKKPREKRKREGKKCNQNRNKKNPLQSRSPSLSKTLLRRTHSTFFFRFPETPSWKVTLFKIFIHAQCSLWALPLSLFTISTHFSHLPRPQWWTHLLLPRLFSTLLHSPTSSSASLPIGSHHRASFTLLGR